MDINETKLELVQMILKSEEIELLEQVRQILSPSLADDWWDKITEEERASIKEGIEQADRGELISHDQAMQQINALFKAK